MARPSHVCNCGLEKDGRFYGHLATLFTTSQPSASPAKVKKQLPPLETKFGSTQATVFVLVAVAVAWAAGTTVAGVVSGSGQQRPSASGR